MEVLVTVDNFEENNGAYRDINSPRTLEACLRSGLDPTELYPKGKKFFREKGLTKEMIDIKYETFEKKRIDKINVVRKERLAIMGFSEKKARSASPTTHGVGGASPPKTLTAEEIRLNEERKAAAMIATEEKRMEALRKRQQDELDRIIEREKMLAETQAKIAHAEEEERKRKKIHDKKVLEEKLEEEKKRQHREQELKQLEHEEAVKRRILARKEAEVEEKLKKQHLIKEREIAKRARELDEERKLKVEEARRKTEALLKIQEDQAEANRIKMLEREQRILQQLEEKKRKKRLEIEEQREASLKRIAEAINKRVEDHAKVEQQFHTKQTHAAELAKINHKLEMERLKKHTQERTEKNKLRFSRLVDSYRGRLQRRQDVISRREERDQVYGRIKAERDAQIAMMKFQSDLRLQDKLENVERVARMNEFRRLQILQKIYMEDGKYEEIKASRDEMLLRHNDEAKNSMIRKHEISETMEKMRMTNDFTLLDKLFANRKSKKDRRSGTGKHDDEDGVGLGATAPGGDGTAGAAGATGKERLGHTI